MGAEHDFRRNAFNTLNPEVLWKFSCKFYDRSLFHFVEMERCSSREGRIFEMGCCQRKNRSARISSSSSSSSKRRKSNHPMLLHEGVFHVRRMNNPLITHQGTTHRMSFPTSSAALLIKATTRFSRGSGLQGWILNCDSLNNTTIIVPACCHHHCVQ
ncbi:hypothetical protein KPH14_007850 [Odynerus spinipes]|uniref:Uncharacterized protein n=1 Tax=Odynerus spinipes TaxID=1348599 RepID=A0AAD9S0H3_9HYME|nr:hypothetical protein KPH14_007850 [Odynerus spinipes]